METTEDGASLFGKKGKERRQKRRAKRKERRAERRENRQERRQQRRAKRHKRRTDRRMFGRGKKGAAAKAEFQAENKAIADVTAQGAQDLSNNAALPGNGGGESYDFGSGSTQQAISFGSSMHKRHGSSMYNSNKQGASMSGQSYDAKQAYNKNLSPKARLHYLENNRADAKSKSKGYAHPILKHMRKF
tara:strand:+ start:1264 stop:1830 length:567 start_codon:yes stop_codon:yes gene_type:complete